MMNRIPMTALLGAVGLSMAAMPASAAPVFFDDFTGDSGALPDDPTDPLDNQDAWFRNGGPVQMDFDGVLNGSAMDFGFRYQTTNANIVLSSTWDTSKVYTFSFALDASSDQLNPVDPSVILGAGDGTARLNDTSVDFTTSFNTSSPSTVSMTIDFSTLTAPQIAEYEGRNIYIRFEKLGASGNFRSAKYIVDDVSLTAVPEPGSLALLGLGGLAVLRRRR